MVGQKPNLVGHSILRQIFPIGQIGRTISDFGRTMSDV